MASPLFDTLFRPTTAPPVPPANPGVASAAPVRTTGTRTRAGNAMGRSRAALLAGAAVAVTAAGTKITMAQVAADAGVAKATLYNHFRTREAVLDALVRDQVHQLVAVHGEQPVADALAGAATALSTHPVLLGLARVEPATLAALGRIDRAAPVWQDARVAVDALLTDAGLAGTDTVLRWLASFMISPGHPTQIDADVRVLLAGLPAATTAAAAQPA